MNSVSLSHSSAILLANCEQKYAHHKVYATPRDPDYEEDDSLKLGKAFHGYLEDVRHGESFDPATFIINVRSRCVEFGVAEEDIPLVAAMCWSYMKMHKASGLEVVVCEQQLTSPEFLGFMDAIMKDPDSGEWWIVDLKTAKDKNSGLYKKLVSLKKDQQLNLYSSFAARVAPHFNLDPNLFKGCRYRVTTKSSAQLREKETIDEYVKRLYQNNSVTAYDAVIPIEGMAVEETWSRFKELHERAMQIHQGEAPRRNYSYCMSYFKPCQFWSQCHGRPYSDGSDIVVYTEGDFKSKADRELL